MFQFPFKRVLLGCCCGTADDDPLWYDKVDTLYVRDHLACYCSCINIYSQRPSDV